MPTDPAGVSEDAVALVSKLWGQFYDKTPPGDPKDTARALIEAIRSLATPSPVLEVAKEALPDRHTLRHKICELIEAYAPNHDPQTGLPVGSEVEQLADLILAALPVLEVAKEALARTVKWLAISDDPRCLKDLHAVEAALQTIKGAGQ